MTIAMMSAGTVADIYGQALPWRHRSLYGGLRRLPHGLLARSSQPRAHGPVVAAATVNVTSRQEERALDRLFASRTVSSESLGKALTRIGRLQGQVRQVT